MFCDVFLCACLLGKMTFNKLFTILRDNKLTRPNYIGWKQNLDIVLTTKEHPFCIYEPKPDHLISDASESETEYYKRWVNERQSV